MHFPKRVAVRGKIEFAAADLGEVELRNIAKPIRAFRILHGTADSANVDTQKVPHNGLSIAVLPFDNVSGVPEQDYIGGGIAENILTDLARFRDLTVVARNSSFAYKGKAARIQDICRDLGANYILEGSVQKAGDRIRVNAQLIDGASGKHIWAERYDRKADDLFALMDDITELIVAMLATTYGGRLRKAVAEKTASAGPTSFDAFENFVRGMTELNRCTQESVSRALDLFAEALVANPHYAKAHAKSCWGHIYRIMFYWTDDEEKSWEQHAGALPRPWSQVDTVCAAVNLRYSQKNEMDNFLRQVRVVRDVVMDAEQGLGSSGCYLVPVEARGLIHDGLLELAPLSGADRLTTRQLEA